MAKKKKEDKLLPELPIPESVEKIEEIKEIPKIEVTNVEIPKVEESKEEIPQIPLPIKDEKVETKLQPTPPFQVFDMETVRRNGEDFGEGLVVILEVMSGEIVEEEKSRIVKERFGSIAVRHPQWFTDANIADIIDGVTIAGVLSPLVIKILKKTYKKLKGEK